MLIDQTLKNLSSSDFETLRFAFEQKITKIIKLPGNKFVGVNVIESDTLKIEETSGDWCYGTISE